MYSDLPADPIQVHWFCDVLEGSVAHVVEYECRIAADVIEQRTAHIDRVRFGSRLYAGCQVDAVSNQIVPLHHDICDMQAEPHPERLL